MSDSARLDGRRRQASVNDGLILDAARAVFLADPAAPIADVARRAGVGISALYRRYPSKEALLRELTRDGLQRFAAALEAGLADERDAWTAYCATLAAVVEGGSQALAQRLAGTFTPDADLGDLATRADGLYRALHRRVREAGVLRDDVSAADVILLLEVVMLVDLPDSTRIGELRQRYLALVLQSLRAPAAGALPGAAAGGEELAARWQG
ncbi:TetR/AcrR family transcriptional regulator [Phycicoccus sonneratiae]|uniref:Helix-turn-helix transcriptional regulator n=1 Tax=Phycicoccus sonneratiae TaxID=2807628 RepID=A0ABS2CRK9_9MICO|nr:TetR/AcrR family transcriptional regulator [Phycicoccus sonneraticus]MBM6402511.1 helix-turn-helix transcriptional regulator [Phycicoccus sonneraticus]